MESDYRRTKYCTQVGNIKETKKSVKDSVLNNHPRARDLHKYISNNKSEYKNLFLNAYGYKCAYCGVSIDIIPKKMFEVDHYIHKSSKKFNSISDAGIIENLVLSCYDCNRAKGDIELSDEMYKKLYPDGEEVKKCFYRSGDYYIKISESEKANQEILNYYNTIELYKEIHRIDFLLMNMIGLAKENEGNDELTSNLYKAIEILRQKRNISV